MSSVKSEITECAICLEENTVAVNLGCGHQYHFECIVRVHPSKCPLCRAPFNLFGDYESEDNSSQPLPNNVEQWIYLYGGGTEDEFSQRTEQSGRSEEHDEDSDSEEVPDDYLPPDMLAFINGEITDHDLKHWEENGSQYYSDNPSQEDGLYVRSLRS